MLAAREKILEGDREEENEGSDFTPKDICLIVFAALLWQKNLAKYHKASKSHGGGNVKLMLSRAPKVLDCDDFLIPEASLPGLDHLMIT